MNGFSRKEEADSAEAPPPQQQDRVHQKMRTQKRLCDYCGSSMALLYCRADSAKLCFSCDREVHAANQLFTKHTRSQLCDACDESPASIFCSTESSVLCQNCDWESHNLSSSSSSVVHDRRPLEGFTGCPSLTELLAIVGFENMDKKALLLTQDSGGGGGGGGDGFVGSGLDGSLGLDDEFSDLLVWDTPSVVGLDDLIVCNPAYKFQAMGVPPLPKNRNAACGRHKDEIICQLRGLAKSEPNSINENVDAKSFMGFQSLVPGQDMQPVRVCSGFEHDAEPTAFPSSEAHEFDCHDCGKDANQDFFPKTLPRSYLHECSMVPDLHSNNDCCASHANDGYGGQMNSEASSAFPRVVPHEFSQNRETALSRYKEKKKTRRYDKHIRYESRKVRAESRTRIRGRFAKMNH